VVSALRSSGDWKDLRGPTEALVALAQLVVAGVGFDRLTRETARASAMALSADRCEVLRLASDGDRLLRVASSDEASITGGFGRVRQRDRTKERQNR
jgi:hypothetical protein